jgi:hypothetical protein
MKQLENLTVQKRYKNADINIQLATWDDGTVSVASVQYVLDGLKIGKVCIPNDKSRIFASVEAATNAAVTWAEQEIDLAI